jgi:hypothetical protein
MIGTMVGDYIVVIEDASGGVLGELERAACSGHPRVGEQIAIDGRLYTVNRVCHEEDGSACASRQYTYARVFVRAGRRGPGERELIPFQMPPLLPGVRSEILPEALIAILVACGYRAQATDLRARARAAAQLLRGGYGWYVQLDDPARARRLSRQAKRYCGEVQALIAALAGGGVPQPSRLSDGQSGRPAQPEPPRGPHRSPGPRRPGARGALRSV